MGRPRTDPTVTATPDRILAAAEDEFAAAGFARARLADIAARAGISRPSLLYHFPTKEALYTEVVRRSFARLRDEFAAAMLAPVAFDWRVEGLVRALDGFLRREPRHARIVIRELLEDGGPGTEILELEIAPLLEVVIAFLVTEGQGRLRFGVDLRRAVLQIASEMFIRHASGS